MSEQEIKDLCDLYGKRFPKTLQRIAKDSKITDIEYHPDGDGIWIYFEKGWMVGDTGCHFVHEFNLGAVLDSLDSVTSCKCWDCTFDEEKRTFV